MYSATHTCMDLIHCWLFYADFAHSDLWVMLIIRQHSFGLCSCLLIHLLVMYSVMWSGAWNRVLCSNLIVSLFVLSCFVCSCLLSFECLYDAANKRIDSVKCGFGLLVNGPHFIYIKINFKLMCRKMWTYQQQS